MRRRAIYIMASGRKGKLYAGVASNLSQPVFQRRGALTPGFTRRYARKLLVYYEANEDMASAIAREKQTKGASRRKKRRLIDRFNPEWRDLYPEFA
jgi:putative endonuclease